MHINVDKKGKETIDTAGLKHAKTFNFTRTNTKYPIFMHETKQLMSYDIENPDIKQK